MRAAFANVPLAANIPGLCRAPDQQCGVWFTFDATVTSHLLTAVRGRSLFVVASRKRSFHPASHWESRPLLLGQAIGDRLRRDACTIRVRTINFRPSCAICVGTHEVPVLCRVTRVAGGNVGVSFAAGVLVRARIANRSALGAGRVHRVSIAAVARRAAGCRTECSD